MQLLIVSASVFQRHLIPGNPGDPTTQYEILLSVTDTSGNQIDGLALGNISCLMDFIEVVGIAPATVTEVNGYGKGLYRVLAAPGNFQGSDPRLLAVFVEQYEEIADAGVLRRSVAARGQVVTTVIHRAQCCTLNPTVNGVVAAYYAINTKGIKIDINCSGVPIGEYQGKEHFQGIQLLKRGTNDPGKLVITSSSNVSGGFFVECEMSLDGLSGWAVLPKEMAKAPLNHSGGFQAFGHCFVGGVENHNGNSMSEVQFWDLKGFPRQLAPMTIPRIGKGKQSTAGAVGISSLGAGAVLAVGSYNSATIDFYMSEGDPFTGSPLILQSTWIADDSFPTYQNLNLITDTNGQLYLVAFWRDPNSGSDWMDLFQVDFDGAWNATLTKIDGIHMYCDGCTFDGGAGIYIPPTGGFEVYAVAYQTDGGTIPVNRFTA